MEQGRFGVWSFRRVHQHSVGPETVVRGFGPYAADAFHDCGGRAAPQLVHVEEATVDQVARGGGVQSWEASLELGLKRGHIHLALLARVRSRFWEIHGIKYRGASAAGQDKRGLAACQRPLPKRTMYTVFTAMQRSSMTPE